MKRSSSLIIACTCALALMAMPASGTNWGSQGSAGTTGTNSGVSLLPDSNMSVKRVNLTPNYSTAVNTVVTNQFNPTDLVATVEANNETCARTSRVCAFDSNYGNNGLYGWTACNYGSVGSNPTRTCAHQWVRFNEAYTPPSYQRLVCHELAHAVGLRHGSQTSSCVYSPIDDANTAALTAHDIAHINARY